MSVADPVLHEYQWLVVVGALAAFLYGFGTGSNDVANAFGTSVGAKTLTLRQAVVIAALFEFTGALVLGRVSTSVIAGGIANTSSFQREPEIFAYGMVCAMTVSGVWQVLASYWEYNVSATHSIIGSILGFSIVYDGSGGVNWQTRDDSAFPPYKGVVPIIVSWFFSPLFTAAAAALLFVLIRFLVLRRENGYNLTFWLLPPLVAITVFICVFFVFTRGAKKTFQESADDEWSDGKSAWIAAVVGAGSGIITAAVLLPLLKWQASKRFNEDGTLKDEDEAAQAAARKLEEQAETDSNKSDDGIFKKALKKTKKALLHGTSVDIFEVVEEDELVSSIHKNAEVFDPKIEFAFQYLQVFSAICVVFSHGAGEVGYMAGPLTAIYSIYTEGKMFSKVNAPIWAILIGAFALVIGLATYGYKVTRAMGVRLAKLSPSRGFCSELATALVLMICSQFGLPTSSSQCITGGIVGVGLCEGKLGVNWKFFGKQFISWVATLFLAGLGTAALFAQGVYSPSIISGAAQVYYENGLSNVTQTMVNNYRVSMMSYQQAVADGVIPGVTPQSLLALNTTLANLNRAARNGASTSQGTVDPSDMMSYLHQALSIYQTNTILTVNQLNIVPKVQLCNSNVTQEIRDGVKVPCPAPSIVPRGIPVTWPPA